MPLLSANKFPAFTKPSSLSNKSTENCKPINLGEETTKESHQIYDQSAVENETINGSFPDEALVKNAEDMGTKLQVENHSDETTSGNDGRTETSNAKEEEFLSQIQNLQKELSFLSSCSLAKEKENLRKDLEKTTVKLKETESKLKNVVQEKTKLEGQKAFAEREVKRLHGQKTLLECDISKRDSLAGRRRDSMVDKSSKMFDSKKSKGLAASFEQIMQEDYRNLEVLAFKMEATIASLEEEVTAAHKKKEETKELEECGSGVECNIDMQKNGSYKFDEETQAEATLLLWDNVSAISMARNPD